MGEDGSGIAWEPAPLAPHHGEIAAATPPTLTFATIFRFNPRIRFADIVETASADRAASRISSPEVNARQRDCALGRETVWR
ncbi:hypothetical protein [Bosea sp. (in: a-proteobacteria)]|uniref:hypothetical protein n=1 Tax=Bosea sp. (in: a-proteobacteria) TaxID=1871050 RepID=UPI0027376064|nr:hypothetical protein [Bosea sp. (in: a-proteobacteria)]MDP3406833.1 hypothetical protein [Bosea sp. (in: a-proteobacteria)]